jgi:predicted RNase H-like nuclease
MMDTPTFIGIDLAWKSNRNPTGAAVLQGDRSGAQLEVVSTLRSFDEVLQFVRTHTAPETVLAIDAPLIVVNETGQRGCETLVGKRYGNRDASCHTSNTKLYPEAASVALTDKLLAEGFVHVQTLCEQRTGRILMEVYPHAAMVALFNLPKILKYKKGKLAQRRVGLRSLQTLLSG